IAANKLAANAQTKPIGRLRLTDIAHAGSPVLFRRGLCRRDASNNRQRSCVHGQCEKPCHKFVHAPLPLRSNTTKIGLQMGTASKAQLMKARVAPPGARGTGPRLRQSGYLTGIGIAELLAGELARLTDVMTLLRVGGPSGCAGHQGCTKKSENDLTHGFLPF